MIFNHNGRIVSYIYDNYDDVNFGYFNAGNGSNFKDYLYYHGNPTPAKNIPVKGQVNYDGTYVILAGDNKSDATKTGNARFNVDFGTKRVTGEFSNASTKTRNLGNLSMNATISENKFSGSLTGTNTTRADVKGAFFGEGAKQLGGVFVNGEEEWGGAFGGKAK